MEIHNHLTSNRCHIQLEIKTLFKKTASKKKIGAYNTLIKSPTVNKPWLILIYSIRMTMTCFIMEVTHQMKKHTVHVVLPKSPQKWNAARRPLVVHLCTARYRELYPLLTTLPSGVLL